jgi:diguanylate cyclase (GGDEF)-like protein
MGTVTIAVGAAATVALFGDGRSFNTFVRVVPSHGIAILLFVPLVIARRSAFRRSMLEQVGSWSLTLLAVGLVFAPAPKLPMAFLTVAPLVWAGARLGMRTAVGQIAVVCVLVTMLSSAGGGPFAPAAAHGQTTALIQLFAVVCVLAVLPLSVVTGQRERALAHVQAAEDLFRRGFDEALVALLLMHRDGHSLRVIEANQAATRKFGVVVGGVFAAPVRSADGHTLADIAAGLAAGDGWRGDMDNDRLGRFAVSMSRLSGGVDGNLLSCQLVDVTAQFEAERALHHLAFHDVLTGLSNRAGFDQCIESELVAAAASGTRVGVVYVDIDNFKTINDTAGHRVGDTVLVEVARRMIAAMRPDDVVARIGGDEFVVVCAGLTGSEDARHLAEQLATAVARPIESAGWTHRLALSVGVAVSSPASTSDVLLTQADHALYASKRAGKARVTLYDADLGVDERARIQLEHELHCAFINSEFVVYMQPVVETSTGRIVAAEALIRWHHPQRGLLAPDHFVEAAEQCGLMPDLGTWVLNETCRQAMTWPSRPSTDLAPPVHVNVSARQLEQPGFADTVTDALALHHLPPQRLILELTESYLATIDDALITDLETLAELGIRFAADDYGTGYSPLTRIIELPVQLIKIDRQFIESMDRDRRALAVVTALTTLADTLDLDIVAEGVETNQQRDTLIRLGIAQAQGHLWSAALTAEAFRDTLIHAHNNEVSRAAHPA